MSACHPLPCDNAAITANHSNIAGAQAACYPWERGNLQSLLGPIAVSVMKNKKQTQGAEMASAHRYKALTTSISLDAKSACMCVYGILQATWS